MHAIASTIRAFRAPRTQRAASQFALFALFFLAAFGAQAAGFEGAKTFMEKVYDTLKLLGPIVLTIAICWAGYKIIFQGAQFRDVANIIIGGLFIGLASTIAGFLLG